MDRLTAEVEKLPETFRTIRALESTLFLHGTWRLHGIIYFLPGFFAAQ